MLTLGYWYLLPLGMAISVIALSAGISGSNFWIPVFLILLGYDTKTGFWLALLTMLFGFGSGMACNLHQKTVNWYIVRSYLLVAIPSALVGALVFPYVPSGLLLMVFSAFVLVYGSYLIWSFLHERSLPPDSRHPVECHDTIYWGRGAVAGFLKGLIATGLGKLILPGILDHRRIRSPAEAVGSTTVIIFIVNIVAVLSRMNSGFVSILIAQKSAIISTMAWVAPGVIIGGILGPKIAVKIPRRLMKPYVGTMLIAVSLLMAIRTVALY